MSRRALISALLMALLMARPSAAAPGNAAPVAPPIPAPSLGPHAAQLEGTWELVSVTKPDGSVMKPPAATSVIVIDHGVVVAASLLQASPERRVGTTWDGRMILTAASFDVIPERAINYDSAATPPVAVTKPPPRSKGSIERRGTSLIFSREDGATIAWDAATNLRTQHDPDGAVAVHRRTSAVPRLPEGLPSMPTSGP